MCLLLRPFILPPPATKSQYRISIIKRKQNNKTTLDHLGLKPGPYQVLTGLIAVAAKGGWGWGCWLGRGGGGGEGGVL